MIAASSPRHDKLGILAVVVACVLAALLGALRPLRAQPASGAPPSASARGPADQHLPLPFSPAAPEHFRPPGSRPGDGGPSPVIFPPQQLTIRFNHRKHAKELGMPCTACHEQAKTSTKSADSLLPPATRCDSCHGTDHRKTDVTSPAGEAIGECAFCHVGYREGSPVARLHIPKPNLRFNHALHLQQRMRCNDCHGQVQELELATADQLPRMRACLDCHKHSSAKRGQASGACTTCHLSEKGGLLKVSFASGKLSPPAWLHDSLHSPDWIDRHKRVAGDESRFCANCHSERYCTSCHDGQVRPRRVHPNDFISMHAVAARQNDPTCTSCHRQQSFCLDCHQRSGVALSGPLANFERRGRFHPPPTVWTSGPRGRSHHAWEAERNLNACVSCHTERDCAVCHATGAVGGRGQNPSPMRGQGANPHPPGFSSRCRQALRSNARPCLVCHDPSDANLGRCR